MLQGESHIRKFRRWLKIMQVPTQSCRPVARNKCSQVPKTKCSYGKWSVATKRRCYFSGLLRRIFVSSDFGYQHETAAFFLNIHCFNWIKFGGRTFQPLLRISCFIHYFDLNPGPAPHCFLIPDLQFIVKKILWWSSSVIFCGSPNGISWLAEEDRKRSSISRPENIVCQDSPSVFSQDSLL